MLFLYEGIFTFTEKCYFVIKKFCETISKSEYEIEGKYLYESQIVMLSTKSRFIGSEYKIDSWCQIHFDQIAIVINKSITSS